MLQFAGPALALLVLTGAPLPGQTDPPHKPRVSQHQEGSTSRPTKGRKPNRLVKEKSPYLRQHAYNPVDWWPWGDAAFAEARRRGVPVFLSVGYSTCHWCHVMEHESFEDEATARFMNENFVCIKLDREERPDIDACYMQYVSLVTRGGGGWPASIWMTAEKAPFYAGTYFPKEQRLGRPSFMQVLDGLSKEWKKNRKDLEATAQRALKSLKERVAVKAGKNLPSAGLLQKAAEGYFLRHDKTYGGFRVTGPKFPSTTTHELLFLATRMGGRKEWTDAAAFSLEAMAAGGIRDHVGGGFHRYATDVRWLVPHFEKMLYDQARISATLLQAGQATGKEGYFEISDDVLDCLLRDFRSPEGGFYCAYDADSGGHEGTYYLWTLAELDALLDEDARKVMKARFHISKEGNWEEQPGANILMAKLSWREVAAQLSRDETAVRAVWEKTRSLLRKIRDARPRPGLDNKILSGWNGLAITALARSGRIRGRVDHLAAARTAAEFVLTKLRTKDGRLWRRYCEGEVAHDGVLRDYAFVIQGLIDLFEGTGETRWIREACGLTGRMIALFADPQGGFFDSPSTGKDLIYRLKETYDGALPSGNGTATRALLRLADLTGRTEYRARAEGSLKAFKQVMEQQVWSSPTLLHAAVLLQRGLREVVVVGDPGWPSTRALRAVVNHTYLPDAVLCLVTDAQAAEAAPLVALLAGKTSHEGKALAYVCRSGVCKEPTGDPKILAAQLGPIDVGR